MFGVKVIKGAVKIYLKVQSQYH